jgi:SAM-dependent methyltransferase
MNKFDKINIDINKLFQNDSTNTKYKRKNFLFRFLSRYFLGALILFNIHRRLINSGIFIGWFDEFKLYWQSVLKGRPLYFHDFHFLLGIYRQRFTTVTTPDYANEKDFLDSWQNKDTVYQLFGAVRRFSYEPLSCVKYEKYIKNNDTVIEYGCGIAPITDSLIKYSLLSNLKLYVADIKQINSHFARWRLGYKAKYLEIHPYKNALENFSNQFNVVFLITVLEHLPDPLNVVKNIYKSLKPGGFLIFDYFLSDGKTQDTIEAVEQRKDVLDFMKNNFNLVKGNLDEEKTINFAVIQKK